MSALRRSTRSSAVLSAFALIVGGLLPAEHVHEARHDAGDRPAVVHRHPQPHHQDGDAVHVESPDDDHEIWLTSAAGITRELVQPAGAQLPMQGPLAAACARPRASAVVHEGGTSIHDPPWAEGSTLRGPPLPSA